MEKFSNVNFDDIGTGDLMLDSGVGWLAKEIQDFTKCKYNHAAIFIRIDGILYVAEMNRRIKTLGAGLVETDFDEYFQGKDTVLICKRKFTIDKDKAVNFITENVGRIKYSYFNLIVAQPILQITERIFGKGLWIGTNQANHMVCSAFASWFYMNMRPDMECWKDWAQKDPQDLYADNVNFFPLAWTRNGNAYHIPFIK